MRPIPKTKKTQAATLLREGYSTHAVASQLGISQRAVSTILQGNKENIPINIGGRPRKLPRESAEYARHLLLQGKVRTTVTATKCLNKTLPAPVSVETVRRGLKAIGMGCKKAVKKPALSKKHIKERRFFIRKYREWTIGDWKRVVYSDEKLVHRISSLDHRYCWDNGPDRITDRTVEGTVKFGGGNVKVWSCFSWHGPGYITKVDDTMDAALYKQILQGELHMSLAEWELKYGDFVFQQVNDSKHTAKIVQGYLRSIHLTEREGTLLMWPSHSPDLNPIEHMWAELGRRLATYPESPKACLELWGRISHEWYAIPAEFCQTLIESMPRRLAAVYRAKGKNPRH